MSMLHRWRHRRKNARILLLTGRAATEDLPGEVNGGIVEFEGKEIHFAGVNMAGLSDRQTEIAMDILFMARDQIEAQVGALLEAPDSVTDRGTESVEYRPQLKHEIETPEGAAALMSWWNEVWNDSRRPYPFGGIMSERKADEPKNH